MQNLDPDGKFRYETFRPIGTDHDFIRWEYLGRKNKLYCGIAKTLKDAQTAAAKFGYKPKE